MKSFKQTLILESIKLHQGITLEELARELPFDEQTIKNEIHIMIQNDEKIGLQHNRAYIQQEEKVNWFLAAVAINSPLIILAVIEVII